jgi:hypothetical protein
MDELISLLFVSFLQEGVPTLPYEAQTFLLGHKMDNMYMGQNIQMLGSGTENIQRRGT